MSPDEAEIKLHNTLSRKVEAFVPIKKGFVTMYQCGPTVYDTPHIGNYRTFVMDDLLRRTFEYFGYSVIQAMNITDIDDKTLRRSREEGVTLESLTRKYEALFLEGLKSLNVLLPHHVLRATEHLSEMRQLVDKLLEKKVAYSTDDGIYMDIRKAKGYGELAGLDLASADTKERINNDEYDKEDPRDFALWKSAQDGDQASTDLTAEGRPGWHIECSAMAMGVFGPTIDIHTGGVDLIFPHHTNEIAQSESATGQKFVNYWVHGGFMTMADEKMAKSKGNVVKLEDLVEHTISPLAFRYWLLTAHYRSMVNFTFDAVQGAQNALIRLMKAVSNLPDGGSVLDGYRSQFVGYISNDLDMPRAVSLVWDILKDTSLSEADKRATILVFDRVFGLNLSSIPRIADEEIPEEIKALAEAREEARKDKDWAKADALRLEIEARGFVISDTKDGIKILPA